LKGGRIDHKFAAEVRTALRAQRRIRMPGMLTPLVLEIIAEKL
jgi:hypothetical protein